MPIASGKQCRALSDVINGDSHIHRHCFGLIALFGSALVMRPKQWHGSSDAAQFTNPPARLLCGHRFLRGRHLLLVPPPA
jgi:hypothetical protein